MAAAGQRVWCRVPNRRTVFCAVSALCCFTLLLVVSHVSRLQEVQSAAASQPHVAKLEGRHDNADMDKGFTSQSLRVVHLDLKGAPPKMTYLRQLLPVLAAAGCNALLIEYEDMFPYQGNIANISAKNAYTRQQVLDLLSWSHALGMQVIPLVQTFGHMEFALKLPEFRHLRELDSFPQELCPSEPASLTLVKDMIRQVMSLHRTARHLHIGCDEVFHLAACHRCTLTRKNGRELYVEHVSKVAEYVRATYPGVTPLVWDDMIRQWSPQYLQSTTLSGLVEPVVWVYTDNISQLVPNYIWYWYSKTFPTIWIAGAFKGATLPTTILPDVQHHYNNQRSWLQFAATSTTSSNDDIKIAGFVLTGWSRFDHFATLCELLPPSVPSLLINLLLISNPDADYETLQQKWRHSLKCPPKSDLTVGNLTKNPRAVGLCSFPGTSSFLLMTEYLAIKSQVDWLVSYLTERKAWMTSYNVRHNFSSPWRIVEDYTHTSGRKLYNDLQAFKNETRGVLSQYYDKHTVVEWTEQRILPLEDKMNNLNRIMETLVNVETWPRRPLA